MIEKISVVLSLLNGRLFLLSAVLFILGLILADYVLAKNIHWLIAYPNWVFRKIEKLMKMFSNVILTFLFIVFFNTLNLFVGFASGFFLFVPLLLAIWTGLNVGIILRKSIGEGSLLLVFLNPVAVFELPAGWISFAMGIEMGMLFLYKHQYSELSAYFYSHLVVFVWLVIPLLVVSGLIEAAMIHFSQKYMQDQNKENRD